MTQTISDYLTNIAATIIYAAAIALLVLFLGVLTKANKDQITDQTGKESITLTEKYGYQEELVYEPGSEVFTDIIGQIDGPIIYLNGSEIPPTYLIALRENNTAVVQDLKSRISFDSNYLVTHRYDAENNTTSVSYTLY